MRERQREGERGGARTSEELAEDEAGFGLRREPPRDFTRTREKEREGKRER